MCLWERLVSNLFRRFERAAHSRPDAIAVDCHDGTEYSYVHLLELVAHRAGALAALGVGRGDRVVVQVEKSIENVLVYLATMKLGAIYVPLNTAYTSRELQYFITDAEPCVVVVEPGLVSTVERSLDVRAHITTLTSLANTGAAPMMGTADVQGRDLAVIVYTSGTTGRSKGAMLSHDNLRSNAEVLIESWAFGAEDVLLHALPLYHVHGLFVALHCALLSGARIRLLTRFDAAEVHAALRGASVFMGVPTYYTRLLALPDFPASGIALRLWISGSAPLLVETFDAFEQRTGQRILERYGMSEAGMITSNPLHGARVPGTVGRALPGVRLRVRKSDGTIAAAGEPGVLEIHGPNVFSGYWRNPEKTQESFTDDGYFITGDVASQSDSGILTIVGRDKDMIISGGLNVYPIEVEAELDQQTGVRESAVIGVPHPDYGEAVVAVIDGDAAIASESELIGALKERLAAFKVPKRVILIDELPRNAMGKVQKSELRRRFATLFEAGP